MRRTGWLASALFHLLLAASLGVVMIRVPDAPPVYLPIALLTEAPESVPPAARLDEPPPEIGASEPAGEPIPSADVEHGALRSEVGVRRGLDWVTGPPVVEPAPLVLGEGAGAAAGPLRRALAEGAADWTDLGTAGTPIDSLLFIQQRLQELTASVLESAREGSIIDRMRRPLPEPGSLDDLRGEPMIPVSSMAGLIAQTLMDLGRDLWNRLRGHDPEAFPEPDLDLTLEQIMAYAALDGRKPISIFEWYPRLHPEFSSGIGRLQELAAELADRNLVRLDRSEQVFRYVQVVPRREVIDYYTSLLSRTPEWDEQTRTRLITIIAILVRIPS